MLQISFFILFSLLTSAFSSSDEVIALHPDSPILELNPSHSGGSPSLSETLCKCENNTFSAGEELTYKLYYNLNFIWIAAGEVKFKVEDQEIDTNCLPLVVHTVLTIGFLKPMITLNLLSIRTR